MKKNNLLLAFVAMIAIIFASCSKDELTSTGLDVPVSGLILTVNGEDYVAKPKLLSAGKFNDTLILKVKLPSLTATVKQISLPNNNSSTLTVGHTINFVEGISSFIVTSSGNDQTYYLKMQFDPPPFMYLIKTSDQSSTGLKYFLTESNAQKIASGTYNDKFEGYIDLKGTNWDNIGLVSANLTKYYDTSGGWYPSQSSGSFTLVENAANGTGVYPVVGPWADWNWVNGNTKITSPGIWKFNFDLSTGKLDLLQTQWAITGSAVAQTKNMLYNASDKTWRITTLLSAGKLSFTTIPVSSGDATLSYGVSNKNALSGYLLTAGSSIEIIQPGNYEIVMNLSSPPFYTYSALTK